jgi:hypothetical protein
LGSSVLLQEQLIALMNKVGMSLRMCEVDFHRPMHKVGVLARVCVCVVWCVRTLCSGCACVGARVRGNSERAAIHHPCTPHLSPPHTHTNTHAHARTPLASAQPTRPPRWTRWTRTNSTQCTHWLAATTSTTSWARSPSRWVRVWFAAQSNPFTLPTRETKP